MTGGTSTVAVVGAGIAGLAAAWELSGAGVRTVVLEGSSRLGGKIAGTEFGGRHVELGPDAFLARRPEAVDLCRELGIEDELVPPGSRSSYLWHRGRLHPLPAGLALGVPTRLGPLAASGVLSPGGLGRVAADLGTLPWRRRTWPAADEPIGPLLGARLGHEVVERLADPLIGGIHAGSVDTMSTAAVFPQLLEAAARPGSLMRHLRQAAATGDPGAPLFLTLRGGLTRLVDALADSLRARGVEVRTDAAVQSISRAGPAWALDAADGPVDVDGLVVALPPGPAASLLGPVDEELGAAVGELRVASVTLVTLRFAVSDVGRTLDGTGYLVPRTGGDLLTACTWLSSKWPHLSRPDDVLVRVSAGRFGDDRPDAMDDEQLVRAAVEELGPAIELGGAPLEWHVTRMPDAFPQYEVGHLTRVANMERAAWGAGIALAGAMLRGVGIPACIASGRGAARAVLEQLGATTSP